MRYFDSERGRTYIRSSLRRSRVVEKLVEDWLAAHPEHPPIPHAEEVTASLDDVASEAAVDARSDDVAEPATPAADDADETATPAAERVG
jgi:hypothetical protein